MNGWWSLLAFLSVVSKDLIEVRANQSTQVLVTTADTCFPAAGGMAAVAEAAQAYKALGGDLQVYTGIWHHGWVLPTREQINGFFCKALAGGFGGGWHSVGCSNSTELDVSHENKAFLEWNDKQLQVTSTGQVVTAPECIAPGARISKTVHNFSADLTVKHTAALAAKRKTSPAAFLAAVIEAAPNISGFIAPPAATANNPRFLGAQFVVPRPPGCVPGRYIPGCPNPTNGTAAAGIAAPVAGDGDVPIGLVERYQVGARNRAAEPARLCQFLPHSSHKSLPRSAHRI